MAQLMHCGGVRADRRTQTRGGIGIIGNRGQCLVEIGKRSQQPLVCTENLTAEVVMMKPAQDGK